MDERSRYIGRLRELARQHHVSVDGNGPNPGFADDEEVTRESYSLVLREALNSGVITEQDLRAEGLPAMLDQP